MEIHHQANFADRKPSLISLMQVLVNVQCVRSVLPGPISPDQSVQIGQPHRYCLCAESWPIVGLTLCQMISCSEGWDETYLLISYGHECLLHLLGHVTPFNGAHPAYQILLLKKSSGQGRRRGLPQSSRLEQVDIDYRKYSTGPGSA